MRRAALALLACALGCPAPGGGSASGPAPTARDALDLAKARGKLVVAMNASYDPFEVMGPDGQPVGFDVDLARAIAKDLGVELELRNVKWDGIIGVLRTGKADAIISGMSVTPERAEAVAFSTPYFQVGQVVVKRKGDERFRSYRDLDSPDVTVAVEQSTTGEQACKKMLPRAKLLRFEKVTEACVAVRQKKADAVVFDNAMLLKYVSQKAKDELEGLWEPFTSEDIAVAVRKDSPKLLAAVNQTLARLRASGELDALIVEHFGEAAAQRK
ncbi:MAG: basic amino acid ABC transporter substrate-binding protein [Planctomycetota bacterium]|nr:MAG: basic amino acid ABC transporter substrate-binding protein [Planctomycetota bacterium]